MKRVVRVGLVQGPATASREDNLREAIGGVREAKALGADIVCLPELFLGPYFCQVQDSAEFGRAEPLDGPSLRTLGELSRELEVDLLASVFERRGPGLYHNTLVHLDAAGEQRAVYRKMHIPQDPQFEEKFYFTPGDLGFVTSAASHPRALDSGGGEPAELGLLVCWDQWYPEAARLSTLNGAEILFYPTAIGWMPGEEEHHEDQLQAWQTMQRSHAIANGAFVVAVNRVGTETSPVGSITFWGHSFICAPSGRVLCEAAVDTKVLVAECDLSAIERQRRIWPFLRDRRIDAYGGLSKRWGR
jgi:N-carbamoylputrescine amidase